MALAENHERLCIIEHDNREAALPAVVAALEADRVALVRGITAEQGDGLMRAVASAFGLEDGLELHAGLAGFQGHRHAVSKHFMSVNQRQDYQFIPPHSEGSSFVGMQMAAFYCHENTTDGGESVLFNVDDDSLAWARLKEFLQRGACPSRQLAKHELLRAKGLYRIDLPGDSLQESDQIVRKRSTQIAGLLVYDVLVRPRRTHSRILGRDTYTYWDSIGSFDLQCGIDFFQMMQSLDLIRMPETLLNLEALDNSANRRIWQSDVKLDEVFRCKITVKLSRGDMIVQNNLSWAHAATNWRPRSGVRSMTASFA